MIDASLLPREGGHRKPVFFRRIPTSTQITPKSFCRRVRCQANSPVLFLSDLFCSQNRNGRTGRTSTFSLFLFPHGTSFLQERAYPFLRIFRGAKTRKSFVHVFERSVIVQIRCGIERLLGNL